MDCPTCGAAMRYYEGSWFYEDHDHYEPDTFECRDCGHVEEVR